jgi:serine/threonine-protein kinase
MALSTGDVIDGKYRIIRLIGEGGMGAVYEGENLRIHRRVAIKVLHAAVAENQDAVQRFEREAQAAGRIGSEHIVEVLDLGNLADGDRFMVMEFMDGDSLSTRIQARGQLTARQTYPVVRQILEALAAAHGAGIIHRDLKPDNVFLLKTRSGQADYVKLLDFGISKFSTLSGESGFSMTRTGSVMGTPYYMSPEQAKGAKGMDHRADLYAVGVILYECVTGRVPFSADTFNELLFKIVLETPQPIPEIIPDSDPEFNKIIQHAMAREPGLRYQTAREFQQALDAWASGQGVPTSLAHTPQPSVHGSPVSPVTMGAASRATPVGGGTAMSPGPALGSVLSPAHTPSGGLPIGAHTPSGGNPTPSRVTPMGGGTALSGGPVIAPSDAIRPGTTPGTWANNTGGGAPVAGAEQKARTPLVAIATAAMLVLVGGAIVVAKMSGGAAAPSAAPAAAPSGPSLEQVRAAAADEAKRISELAQKEADEKIKKAEDEARAAEERAKKAEADSKEQEEATAARERVKVLKAAVTPKPSTPKPEAPKPEAPKPDTQPGGRRIRTEL